MDGVIESVSADEVVLKEDNGVSHTYKLLKFKRFQPGHLHQPAPDCGKRRAVKVGQVLADGPATSNGGDQPW